MARRKKGDRIDGWLVVDKPLHVGSTDVVARARWAFNARKVGHSGTLDPLATGVLAIAFGEATKTVPFVTDADKAYRFTVRFGEATSTDDAEGPVIATSPARPSDEEIRAALPRFTGDIMQVPPAFSAVKVQGKRAYDLARAGEALELKARPLHVASLDLVERPDADHAVLEMVCGKGGYVRSIARDLGEALGCHAHVRALRRLWSGPFELSDAVGWEALERLRDDPAKAEALLPLAAGLHDLEEIDIGPREAADLRQGRAIPVRISLPEGEILWACCAGEAVAVGELRGGELRPSRVFAAAEDPAEETAPTEQK